jgi:hypothetical protein
MLMLTMDEHLVDEQCTLFSQCRHTIINFLRALCEFEKHAQAGRVACPHDAARVRNH